MRADVVIPFRGSDAELRAVLARMDRLRLGPGDTLTVADNRPGAPEPSDPRVIRAGARQTSYHARNAGAARGSAPWIFFLDADVEPVADLLDRYFEAEPADDVAVLAGRV